MFLDQKVQWIEGGTVSIRKDEDCSLSMYIKGIFADAVIGERMENHKMVICGADGLEEAWLGIISRS